jgi:hypothetical protein
MDFSVFFTSNLMQNAAGLTVILAIFGYMATFMSAQFLTLRKDKLDLINRRLNEFYGPLYVASQVGNIAYHSLLQKQGKTQSFPILDGEMKEWMLWMTTIFMPLNDIREKIIIEKAALIIEEEMPQCLLDFVTHVSGYKAVLAKWSRATTPSAARPSAGRRSSTSMSHTPMPFSKPSKLICCIASPGGSGTGCSATSRIELGHKPEWK